MQGLLPIDRSQVPADVLAGATLAALGIPEVLGYAKIAGMPVVTGLYTLLLPIAVFAVLVPRGTWWWPRIRLPPSFSPPR